MRPRSAPELVAPAPVPRAVLVNAGPWLPVPPPGYGGIENVVATLVPALRERGVRVVLCAAGGSTLDVDRLVTPLADPRFEHLRSPYAEAVGVAHAHMAGVLAVLDEEPDIDVVHDHLEVVGPAVLAAAGDDVPPVLQTLHWDLRKHPDFYSSFDGHGRVFFNALSARQLAQAPAALRRQVLTTVPLATEVETLPFRRLKGDHHVVLARISPLKGQHVAARVCRRQGLRLVLAGHIQDEAYWRDEVQPQIDGTRIAFAGDLGCQDKLALLSSARAALFPVQWEEPGGTAVVEALGCGTPVVGLRRGCLPELVQHGITGFLADTEEELGEYLLRVDEIDPVACRKAAAAEFSPGRMAERYLELYGEVMRRAAAAQRARRTRPAARGADVQPVPS